MIHEELIGITRCVTELTDTEEYQVLCSNCTYSDRVLVRAEI